VLSWKGFYRIGNDVCPETPHRLFAHQIGDGFVIVSQFADRSPELPLAIGTFLLRNILLAGGIGKCALSQGEFADIQGCYPEMIRENANESGAVRLGRGLMRVFPVMGSALINAYRLSKRESGALLLLDSDLQGNLPQGAVVAKRTSDYSVLDWVHTDTPEIDEIASKTGINHPQATILENKVRDYTNRNGSDLPKKWVTNTLELNGC
jgi:hypothetical protein